jgi:hypothetical protein
MDPRRSIPGGAVPCSGHLESSAVRSTGGSTTRLLGEQGRFGQPYRSIIHIGVRTRNSDPRSVLARGWGVDGWLVESSAVGWRFGLMVCPCPWMTSRLSAAVLGTERISG